MSRSIRLPIAAAMLLLTGAASAQTVLAGNVSDGAGGPLLSGVVYHVPSGISVPTGATLTVQPGVIVKLGGGATITVSGALLAGGTTGQPVIVTSLKDDTAGGDTNGDGASSGSAGDWTYVRFGASAGSSVLQNVTVRFGGAGGWNPVRLDDCAATFRECIVEESLGSGFNLTGGLAQPTIADCTIRNNAGWAIEGARFESVFNLANNTATGNGANSVLLSTATLAADAVVNARCGINGVLTLATTANVPAGRTLTLGRGVILKHQQTAAFEVGGTLNCQGTAGQPVVITSSPDDAYGGDSNADGPSSGSPAQWVYLRFGAASSASTLTNTILRFGGAGGWSPIRVDDGSPTFTNCVVEHAPSRAVVLSSLAGAPTFAGCTFRNNGGWAIEAAGFESIVNCSNNTATGNGTNGVMLVNSSPTSDVVIGPQMGFGGVICLQTSVNVAAGRTLTFQAGTILKKLQASTFEVSGALIANGTAAQPVVFTSFADDDYGGDSNNNGASVGAPGQWIYVRFHPTSSASRLTNAVIRHGGGGGWNPVYISGGSPTLERCTIERGANAGISLAHTATQARIDDCTVRDCTGAAIANVPIDSLPYITRLKASGNGANQVAVTVGTLQSDLYFDANMGLNGVAVMHTTLLVPVGRKLTLGPGALFKMNAGQRVDVLGALDVVATREEPVVFTASSDDSIGGDSDGVNPAPAAGFWLWFLIDSVAAPSRVENLHVRYGGGGGWPAIRARSALAEYRHVRVERAGSVGFEFLAAARADFVTAWQCTNTGILLIGGSFTADHATVNGCANGISRTAGWNGVVRNSIAFGNTANFVNFGAGQVEYSTSFLGGLGNLNVDPLFVNSALGDLQLQPGSPCVDAGDPSSPKDADCTRTDMGAYPTSSAPTLYCAGKVNSFGCTPFLGYSGFARATSTDPLVVRCFNVLSNKQGLFYYGFSGRANTPFQGGLKCVADPVRRTPLQNSGGLISFNNCSGVFALDFTALINSGLDPLLVPGATINLQSWHRDPGSASSTGLSNALEFAICN